jgi:predicted N-acetyltransferase YhbS
LNLSSRSREVGLNIITIRPGTVADAAQCGRIIYEAFKSINDQHNFPQFFPDVKTATGLAMARLSHPKSSAVVGELQGKVVGSNFLDERAAIGGLGPITVDPSVMNSTIGHQLMQAVMERAKETKLAGVRLVQIAWHFRSFALYSKHGFEMREMFSAVQGKPINTTIPGHSVRRAREEDLGACNELHLRVHGFERADELLDAILQKTALVVENLGALTGYTTGIGWGGYAVAATNNDLKALIGAAPAILGPGFLVPSRNGEIVRWCLANGLRIFSQATLMTVGLYQEPQGAYLPSIVY